MSSTNSDTDNKLTSFENANNVCKYYNPYFGNGCKSGEKCKFKHMKAKEFIGFCTRINKENKPSNTTRNIFRSAIDLLKKGKADKAVKKFEKIIKTCPFDELYNMWFARCHEELNNLQEAEFYYRRSISIQPKFATAHGRYAEFSWHKLNNIKQANVHFQKSLQNKENHVTHRHYAQFIEQKFNDYKKSQYHFERCLELSPNDHGAHHSYAIVLQKMNANTDKIRYHYDESIKLYDCANIHYSYALYLKNINENKDALKHFQACLEYDGYNAMYHFQFGLFLIQNIGAIDDGLIHINNACNLKPNDQLYQEMYAKLKANKNKKVYRKKSQESIGVDRNKVIIADQTKSNTNNIITAKSHWGQNNKNNNNNKDHNNNNKINQSPVSIPNQQKRLNYREITAKKCEIPLEQQQQQTSHHQFNHDQHELDRQFDEYLQIEPRNNLESIISKCRHQCEIEFERFVKEKVVSGPAGQYYVDRFNEKKINDIRLIEFIDYTFLKTEIGMNELHIRMMLKKVEKFKKDVVIFRSWLHSLKMYDEYYEKFEMNGIVTFELFYHYIISAQDIIDLFGKQNLIDAMYLFDNTPKQNRQNALREQSNYAL